YAMFPDVGREFIEQRRAGTLQPEPLEPLPSAGASQTKACSEFNVSIHGENYHIKVAGTGHKMQDKRAFFISVDGIPEEIIVESLNELDTDESSGQAPSSKGSSRPKAISPGHVTTSMPGIIVDVLVKVDDEVEAGIALIVTEAMKMETEIQAPVAGKITAIYVKKGDSVNPDEVLIEID
ncbi:MAG: biotin/lipoyl-binding protein, partial [Gammaproteobacteria bacterium]|nr:biotin/lipoyl-binding protein [Gammaproteobacteria bacterium]